MNYTIEIINKAGEGEESKVFAGTGNSKTSNNKGDKTEKRAKTLLSASQVVPFVKQAMSFSVNTISLKSGAEEAQQRAQFAYNVASQTFDLGRNIWIGSVAGGLPGALIGAGLSILTTISGYAYNTQEIKMQSNLEQISLMGLNRRAGGYAPAFDSSRRE